MRGRKGWRTKLANKNYGGSGGVAKQENTLDVDNDGMKLSLENTTFFLFPLFYPHCFFLFFFYQS